MIIMATRVKKEEHIPVDLWDTPENPIREEDRIFRNIKGEVILPVSSIIYGRMGQEAEQENKQLDYFAMNTKRSYNSDTIREHICRYLNYFEKYYDTKKELLMVLSKIKLAMDYNKEYTPAMFMNDVNVFIIRNHNLYPHIHHFVEDNYMMKLSSNNNRTPNLQFEDKHAKILYEISLLMNMYIPLATHYMYIHFIKQSEDTQNFMLELFDLCVAKYEDEQDVDIYSKMYETANSVVNKSKNPDRPLWEKNMIRGVNPTTHTKDSVNDIILQIIPKYSYWNREKQIVSNIVNFNYTSNQQCLRYKVIGIPYEYPFVKLSSSKRDADQNSEYDKFESKIVKKDESLLLQNKCQAEQTIRKIELLYGPFGEDEIMHYKRRLTKDGRPVINSFQKQLIGYVFFKEFGDPISLQSINQIDYIKLLIAAKRILKRSGMVNLPYVISSRVVRVATRKNVNKKELLKLEASELYEMIKAKYRNPKMELRILEMIGKIISSSFEIIDYDEVNHKPTEYDGLPTPIINDVINEELLFFVNMI